MKLSKNNWFVESYVKGYGENPKNLCSMFWGALLSKIPSSWSSFFWFVAACLFGLIIMFGSGFIVYETAAIGYKEYQNGTLLAAIGFITCCFAVFGAAFVALFYVAVPLLERLFALTIFKKIGGIIKVVWAYLVAKKQKVCPLIEVIEDEATA